MLWLACWPRTSSRSKDLSTTQLHCSTTSVTGGRQSLNEVGAGCCTNHFVRQHSLRMMMLMTAAELYYSIYTSSLGGSQRVWRLHLDCPTNLKCRRWNASPNAGAWSLQALCEERALYTVLRGPPTGSARQVTNGIWNVRPPFVY